MKPLNLKTYTDKELKMIIPALGTFIRPLPYKGGYLASCSHYSDDCTNCPFDNESDLCGSIYAYTSGNMDHYIDSHNKFFPDSFIEKHPEYLI